jgi:hypothetical protein
VHKLKEKKAWNISFEIGFIKIIFKYQNIISK